MTHLLSPVLCWLLGSACGPSAFQIPVQERKCKGKSLHFTPPFSLVSKYLQKEQTGICQRVPSHPITVNQHKHPQCTWLPGHGTDTHPRAAGELLEASLALGCLSPWHSPGTPRGLGAAARALCWECSGRCSLLRHRQALSACRSGGRSSVAWSARRWKMQLFIANTLAVPKWWENRIFRNSQL